MFRHLIDFPTVHLDGFGHNGYLLADHTLSHDAEADRSRVTITYRGYPGDPGHIVHAEYDGPIFRARHSDLLAAAVELPVRRAGLSVPRRLEE